MGLFRMTELITLCFPFRFQQPSYICLLDLGTHILSKQDYNKNNKNAVVEAVVLIMLEVSKYSFTRICFI